MRNLLFILCLFSVGLVFGQTTYNKFQWAPSPVLHAVDKKYEEAAAVYITDERINEYAIEKDGFFFYRTLHRIVHLNNDKGIEGFNKIYLPDDADMTMVDVKARTILPGGKIIEMDRNNIKDLKDDDGQYKIFALEGLTKGCEVEYYFTVKKDPSFFGREILASRVPSMKTSFKLIAPQHLFFETKSFNGLPASKESLANEKRWLQIDDEIDEALEEKYSNYQASLKQVEYKLCYNKARNATERLFTWNELAKKIYTIYSSYNDKDKKRIKELLDDIAPKGTETEKITAIENFMKKNFITRKDIPSDDTQDLGKVIKNKTASHKAICKLFTGLYTEAGINFQIVLAGDRTDYMVDKNFENWDNTQNFILYFPSTKKYLSPTDIDLRYPWIPPTWAETNGLFCVPTTIGNFTTAFGEIRYINQEASKYNFINLDIHLKLDKEDALVLDVKQSYGGYAASNYKYPFNFLPAEQQRDILKQLIKFGTNSENMISQSFENREMEQADPYKPFVINASVKSTNLMEKAGDKLLLKVGELIGEQAEMYETKPRATEIDIAFPHVLDRVIELTIPEGYQVKNAQDLQIKEVYNEGNEETMGFVSSYVQHGNVMKITIHESYNRVRYPKLQYDAFKKIINASADFNKIVLILAKS